MSRPNDEPTLQLTLSYGRTGLDVSLPRAVTRLVEPEHVPGLADPAASVRDALRNPIGSEALSRRVGPAERVAVVLNDITRATPYEQLLPPLLSVLSHLRDEQIVFFVATGTHRPNTTEELERMLGPGIVGRFRIVQNDCRAEASHRYVGTTAEGNEIYLLAEFLDCDLKIATGFIEPHFFAGFSGGWKAFMPGLAHLSSIRANHSALHLDDPQARWGITSGNPLWRELREGAGLAGNAFLLNIALNGENEITGVFAGDMQEAHRRGCEYVASHAIVELEQLFDIVVASNSGYPLDLNMYQAVKGMSAAAEIVKPGGHIVIAADCWDGIPEHGEYGTMLRETGSVEELLTFARSFSAPSQDSWQAHIHALVCRKATVHFYSEHLSDAQIESAFMSPCRDISARVRGLLGTLPAGATVAALPYGPQTIARGRSAAPTAGIT